LVSAAAIFSLAGAAIGYFGDRCSWYESLMLFGSSVFLIMPGLATDLIGLALVSFIFIYQKRRHAASGTFSAKAA
jgi:TRAP-type uncharacterized transport system fused permease subunit